MLISNKFSYTFFIDDHLFYLFSIVMYWDKNIQKFFCVEMKENESESENNGSEIQSNNFLSFYFLIHFLI